MKLFTIGSTVIKASPLLLLLLLYAVLAEDAGALMLLFFCLSLHEGAHAVVAKSLGYGIKSIELQPFGFVAVLSAPVLGLWDQITVAAAGPLFSLLAGVGARAILLKNSGELAAQFAAANIGIALVNLLPALPLDGGRVLQAVLCLRLSVKTATRVTAALAALLSLLLLAAGTVLAARRQWNLSILIFGVFLFAAALREWRKAGKGTVDAYLKSARSIKPGEERRVTQIAVHEDTPCLEALALCRASSFTLLTVLDNQMRVLANLDETALMNGILCYGKEISVGKLARRN